MVKNAHRGYETFHQLPEGSSPPACLKNSSAGILGWAKYMETIKASKIEPLGERTMTCAMSNCCMMTEPPIGFGSKLMNALRPRLDIDLLTRADAPGGISIIAPKDDESGWELIEITVDSGACDKFLPSRMLSSIRTESTEASRAGEEYEVANGHAILNEGETRCIMTTPGSSEPKGIIFQVSDVHKPLMSVGSMADAGFEWLLSKTGGFMRDVDRGERIPLTRRGNLYHLRAWVKGADSPPLGGPGG